MTSAPCSHGCSAIAPTTTASCPSRSEAKSGLDETAARIEATAAALFGCTGGTKLSIAAALSLRGSRARGARGRGA